MSTENKSGALATLWRAVLRLLKGQETSSQADNPVTPEQPSPQIKKSKDRDPVISEGDDVIEIVRTYHDDHTKGVLTLADGFKLYTIEKPWRKNKRRVSCIPEGVYEVSLRTSPIVQRTSRGRYTQGWEVVDVPDRTYIMFHIANTADDVEGCIGMGISEGQVAGKPAVLKSRVGFNKFMNKMKGKDTWTLVIRGDK